MKASLEERRTITPNREFSSSATLRSMIDQLLLRPMTQHPDSVALDP